MLDFAIAWVPDSICISTRTFWMPALSGSRSSVFVRCLCAKQPNSPGVAAACHARRYTNLTSLDNESRGTQDGERIPDCPTEQGASIEFKEEGALTRRLRDMSEEALESGGYGALKAVQEAGGFSDDLKAQLEQRIAGASLRSSEAALPTAASRHTRDLAATQAWTGTESTYDASLRMLNDAHRPLRTGLPSKTLGVHPPRVVDTGHRRNNEGRGARLANARDRSTVYANVKEDARLDAMERETRLQLLKDRFDPHARTIVPGTISGIASLASQRIEDAIARGQFKNIPRGKGTNVVRDHNASSPFIETTEYFLNKMIQKQDIVPPWIEKQQELTVAANKFRTRLRYDWKRHAARMISRKGGSLDEQVQRAEAYAKAELFWNPLKKNKKEETIPSIDSQGQLSRMLIASEIRTTEPSGDLTGAKTVVAEEITAKRDSEALPKTCLHDPSSTPPLPFRDADWERTETAYLNLAIKELNDKARSYNLQAPDLAKKPYFNLQRELNACYADIAPQLPAVILDRARTPPKTTDVSYGRVENGVLGSIMGGPVRVRDERKEKQYGFRQFWKDLWKSGQAG